MDDRPVMVDLVKVMVKYMHMTQQAAEFAFGKGNVKLNGRMLSRFETKMAYEPVRGQLLECAGRTVTLGSRPAGPIQQSLDL